jgi:hypothetical protein
MMEIVYGPVLLSCAVQSIAFGLIFAWMHPFLMRRFFGVPAMIRAGRAGLALLSGGLFGLGHLALVCSADGFPPRIIQSAAVALVAAAVSGTALLARSRHVAR